MDYRIVQSFADKLMKDANALSALVLNRNKDRLAATGDGFAWDVSSDAGETPPGKAEAKELKEKGDLILLIGGRLAYMKLLGNRVLCIVFFDRRSTLGLVRVKTRKAGEQLIPSVKAFDEFTDSDIDNLFG